MATSETLCNKRHLVRLEIGVSAQFKVDTHQEVTYENLRNYFTSPKFFDIKGIKRIIAFLNDAEAMGCKIMNYHNPLSASSMVYAEFEVEVPKDIDQEFENKYARYSYLH